MVRSVVKTTTIFKCSLVIAIITLFSAGMAGATEEKNPGLSLVLKGCDMVLDGIRAIKEKKDPQAASKTVTTAYSMIKDGKRMMLDQQQHDQPQPDLPIDLISAGAKMVLSAIRMLEDEKKAQQADTVLDQSKLLVTDGRRLLLELVGKSETKK